MRSILVFVLTLTFATSAIATDGVLEINHTCAAQTGCFAGDSAGYPVTIDHQAGGSYRLTSDLIVPDANTTGIEITLNDVTIDLNGFSITRAGCVGSSADCTPAPGTGYGVRVLFSSRREVTVKNGNIVGMGHSGVSLAYSCQVTGVRARWNGVSGIRVGTVGTVSDSTANDNGGDGIVAGSGSTVFGNRAYSNNDDGIVAGSGSNVLGNTVRFNQGYGLNLSSQAAYGENVVTSNGTGTVNGSSLVDMLNNACDGNLTCP